jgi:Baseplate J-like protein
MPIPRYMLADLDAEALAQELVRRIPAHTPEWRNAREGDPGRTLIDLFAWLSETLLYRVNLIPERQRLEFLRLLNIGMRPAQPARALVQLGMASPDQTDAVPVPRGTPVAGPVTFETIGDITVQPLQGRVYHKRRPSDDERDRLSEVLIGLEAIYGITVGSPYITTPLFANGLADPAGIDVFGESVDEALWIALLAATPEAVPAARRAFEQEPVLLNIGIVPRLVVPDPDPAGPPPAELPRLWQWEITSARPTASGAVDYITLEVERDDTLGFGKEGVQRLLLPPASDIGLPPNDVDDDVRAGVGDRPPRLDDPDAAARLLTWLRLRPTGTGSALPLSWLGTNAVAIDQRKTLGDTIVGTASGVADQVVQLPASSVDPDSLVLEVVEGGRGFVAWQRVSDLGACGRDDRCYELDPEAGSVTFGDGVRGRRPEPGARIRIAQLRAGGGRAGNLPAGNLAAIQHPRLTCAQPAPATGGEDAETLALAEGRITQVLRHGNRCVTAEDYRALAFETPGVTLGRAEVLSRFRPFQRRFDSPGTVSVMVLPAKAVAKPANPRPDRNLIERVRAHLDARRPLATELYVIGCEYRPLGVSVAIGIREGAARDQVVKAVRETLQSYLWSLPPGGRDGAGWPLGQAVVNLELEVIVARVAGVRTTRGVNLFSRDPSGFALLGEDPASHTQRLILEPWQLPELLQLAVAVDAETAPASMVDERPAGEAAVPIPVVPEVC